MNFSKLPYTIIGLMGITLCLVGVLSFQGTHFKANLEADAVDQQISNLIDKHKENPDMSSLPKPIIAETKDPVKKIPKVSTEAVKVQVASANILKTNPSTDLVASSIEQTHKYTCSPSAFEQGKYAFEVLTPEISYQVKPGEAFSTVVYIKNTGTNNWCGELTQNAEGRLRLGTSAPQDRASSIITGNNARINMQAPEGIILPGETAAFIVKGVAPQASGIYREFFSPVAEGVGWFPEVKISLDVYVGDYTEKDFEKLYYLQTTGNTNEFKLDDLLTINIDISNQTEHIYKGNKLIHSYLVSSGAYKTPTPLGVYEIYNKQTLRIAGKAPHYRMPFWIGLKRPGGRFRGYGLHALPYLGNNKSSSYFWKEAINHLGTRVSHGCIRRSDNDAEWLWTIVDPETTKVEVFSSFDPSTFLADSTES